MKKFSHLAAAVALFTVFGAPAAMAQSHDWSGWQVTLGASSVESTMDGDGVFSPMPVEPSGTMVDVGLNHRWAVGHVFLGAYTNVQVGSVEASASQVSCTVSDCGFEEVEYSTERMNYALSAGVSIGHEIGPVLVSVIGGVTVGDYTHIVRYTSGGVYPDYLFEQKGFRAGYHYGLAAEYAFTDRWSARVEFRRTELVEQETESSFVNYDAGLKVSAVTLSGAWNF